MEFVIILCPVCRELLEEPVSLPCSHELCLDCFKNSLEAGNLHCPLCRRRISTWARRRVRNPVNSERKEELNRLYTSFGGSIESLRLIATLQREEEGQPKLDTIESSSTASFDDTVPQREEEEEEKRREREMLDEQEAIRLQQEEDKAMQLEIQRQVKEDEKLAQKISKEFELSQATTTSTQSPSLKAQAKKNKIEEKKTQPKEEQQQQQQQHTLYNWFHVLPKS